VKACPLGAISVPKGVNAVVDYKKCIGCGKCTEACPASLISIGLKGNEKGPEGKPDGDSERQPGGSPGRKSKSVKDPGKKPGKTLWYDYLWISAAFYLTAGFFNILFAWIGLYCFLVPLVISITKGNKAYCCKFCGRGQLFGLIGGNLGLSLKLEPPKFLRSNWFRYGFLTFFMTMFVLMIHNTYLVFAGATMKETLTLLWVFKLPWNWLPLAPAHGYASIVPPWVAQFGFGFYGVMLTSTVMGLVTMIIFKPRTWCVYCPMGSMTQIICKIKHKPH